MCFGGRKKKVVTEAAPSDQVSEKKDEGAGVKKSGAERLRESYMIAEGRMKMPSDASDRMKEEVARARRDVQKFGPRTTLSPSQGLKMTGKAIKYTGRSLIRGLTGKSTLGGSGR